MTYVNPVSLTEDSSAESYSVAEESVTATEGSVVFLYDSARSILPVSRFGKIKPSASDNQGLSTPEFMIIVGADNSPPMLEKSLYDSWKSRMELYIENQENERMILNSIQNGPLVWLTVDEEDGTTRTKKYEELFVAEKLQADCD
ncbi:hypothetical protein Tco_0479431 [Tanacetum coccineum]